MDIETLIKLAGKIKDKSLREKTIEILKDIRLTHPELSKLEREDPEKVKTPFGVNNVFVYRDLITHTVAVTEGCLNLAEVIAEKYKIEIKTDYLIAGALLHDIMKVYEFKDGKQTDILLDHSSLALSELYKRDFPVEVLHMVVSHLGTPSNPPKTIEALILHYIDTLFALIEFSNQQQKFLLGEL
ncbi:MAG: HD domain-containing protein [Candidatus Aenigmarchaeota archaeon]|nr:HD domain-containing protein [Candidatus Aenigmarchaeota archaeon]MCX8190761.1 HD domain-containing protein [Candidatus Aenigmarchaeota archaeon]MDW8160008.1 HD domain-containing protein [Candidatus Aenigmarchaeota archaeon]